MAQHQADVKNNQKKLKPEDGSDDKQNNGIARFRGPVSRPIASDHCVTGASELTSVGQGTLPCNLLRQHLFAGAGAG